MTDIRIVPCETCQSEGRIYRGQYEDERDCGECPACEGTGGALIEVEPVEMEDLDAVTEPTNEQLHSACLSYRHDYGLLEPDEQRQVQFHAREWLRAWQKEGFALAAQQDGVREALESIVRLGSVNNAGEYESGLRGIIRSMTDCARRGLEQGARET